MTKRLLIPQLPHCKVYGRIVESDNPSELGEDMLDVVLPNGLLITVGWYPEAQPTGKYYVLLHRDYNQIIPELTTRDADKALQDVFQLVERYSDRNVACSCSDSEDSVSIQDAVC